MSKIYLHLSSFQIITLGFLIVILTGSFLLMLPISSQSGQYTRFIDALFTATSAVCVTGLVVYDTATYWSYFGQLILLILIQIGGLGVVTIAISLAILSGKKVGLIQRSAMQDAIAAPKISGIVRMTVFILKGAAIIECIATMLLSIVFIPSYGVGKGLWYSLFHAISAFCNAGFDLMGIHQPFSSLTGYYQNPLVNVIIMGSIIIGGIGFLSWEDLIMHKWKFRKYRLQTKIILLTTVLLLVFPAIFFYTTQFQNYPFPERLLLSLFQSVTPRTAGFNTADLTTFTQPGIMVLILLMMIGGSPGSTAGGMKITTIVVMVLSTVSVFRRKENIHCFKRRIAIQTVFNASAIFVLYISLLLIGGMSISLIENIDLLTCFFESASAIGTVGLTLGITPYLSVLSKIILILLMYLGRVGGMTLAFATMKSSHTQVKRPLENVAVG